MRRTRSNKKYAGGCGRTPRHGVAASSGTTVMTARRVDSSRDFSTAGACPAP
jgi:hypothetical protein